MVLLINAACYLHSGSHITTVLICTNRITIFGMSLCNEAQRVSFRQGLSKFPYCLSDATPHVVPTKERPETATIGKNELYIDACQISYNDQTERIVPR